MKIYNVTRWMKIPVIVMVLGEDALAALTALTGEQFIAYFNQTTDRDEQQAYWQGTDYEQIGEQEVEFAGEDE